jgi:hypothetical protein
MNMKNSMRVLALSWMAFASGAALADIVPAAVHETSSKSITLPKEIGGDAIMHACRACPTLRLATNDRTEFRIGEVRVSLATMRLELQQRTEQLILVRNSPGDRVLVALVLSAAP